MPHDRHSSGDEPRSGASEEAVRQGFEPLSTNTRALVVSLLVFFVVAAGMLWGLMGLLHHYLAETRRGDVPGSSAPVLPAALASPLEPMPSHNDLDWQDLVHLRQQEDAQFRRQGWSINPKTGEAEIPAAVAALIVQRHGGATLAAQTPSSPLRFPPPMAPVHAGPYEPLPLADVFPPVGSAAAAEQAKESIYRPATGPSDVKDLPTQSGPPGLHDNPSGIRKR